MKEKYTFTEITPLMKEWKSLRATIEKLTAQEQNLYRKITVAKQRIPVPLGTMTVQVEPKIVSGPNARIGDAMEDILSQHAKLSANEIVDLLRARNVRISLKNPRIVIATTLKQDKRQRFVRLDDNRIALRKG